jgi:hypothetical protein
LLLDNAFSPSFSAIVISERSAGFERFEAIEIGKDRKKEKVFWSFSFFEN